MIHKAYEKTPEGEVVVSWDDVVQELQKTTDIRPGTLQDYLKTVRVFRDTIKGTRGPADVTVEHAKRFKRLFGSTGFTRSKAKDATVYKRSSTTTATYLRKLSALWNKHFDELGYVKSNPWSGISPPLVDKVRKHVPTTDEYDKFLDWLQKRYPDWTLVRLWVITKALAGCRTMDLCSLKTSDLRDGRLFFPASVKKERRDRVIKLSPNLFASLQTIAGPTWLWERYAEDAKKFRPGTKNKDEFDPKTLFWAVSNIFREFNDERPGQPRLTPHSLKRRAITLATRMAGSVDAAANAIGTTSQTAQQYYLDAKQAYDADLLFEQLAKESRAD
jgi:integrase